MEAFKKRWQIRQNWQLIFPLLGIISLFFSGYIIFKGLFKNLLKDTSATTYYLITLIGTLILSYILLRITLWFFKKLEHRWEVSYRWELISIFLVFALTGSTAARLSDPVMHLLGMHKETMNGGLFWTIRILIIFPVYQVLLVCFGWLFGQFDFFWKFEKKMLSRLGFKRFFKE